MSMRAPREEPVEEYVEPGVSQTVVPDYARYPYARRDVTRWGPVIAGVITSIAILVALTVLGAGFQVINIAPSATPLDITTGLGIWAAISTLIALFVGGYLAGWAAGVGGWVAGLVQGTLVWATILVSTIVLSGLGISSFLGNALGQFGRFIGPNVTAPTPGQTASALLWTFAILVVGWAVAAIGGMAGGVREPVVPVRERVVTHEHVDRPIDRPIDRP